MPRLTKHARVLTLDLATVVGYATWHPGRKPDYGHHILPKTNEDVGAFLNAYYEWWNELITEFKPDLVAFEAPWVGPKTHQDVATKLFALAGFTEFLCHRAGYRCVSVNISSWRKHTLGIGGGPRDKMKSLTMKLMRALGFSPRTDDEADALGILIYIADLYKLKPDWPVGPLYANGKKN